jgi:hypothetical protein
MVKRGPWLRPQARSTVTGASGAGAVSPSDVSRKPRPSLTTAVPTTDDPPLIRRKETRFIPAPHAEQATSYRLKLAFGKGAEIGFVRCNLIMRHFRFGSKLGSRRSRPPCPLSPPIATKPRTSREVRFVAMNRRRRRANCPNASAVHDWPPIFLAPQNSWLNAEPSHHAFPKPR